MDKGSNSDVLHIGDYILLKNLKFNSLLCAEGIFKEELTVDETAKNIDDSLFCVHLQRQYSAAREFEEFLKVNGTDLKSIKDPNKLKYYHALKRGADNERKLNDSYFVKRMGEAVSFGDIIQLFHMKSKKYVTVIPDQLANDERENIRIVLDAKGNSYAWMQLVPRYKIDREGDRLLNQAEVYLRVAERANEFIHRADRDPIPGMDREVNCCLEPTAWRVTVFQSSLDMLQSIMLLSSELVYISDPETRCCLTVAQRRIETLDDEPTKDAKAATGGSNDQKSSPAAKVKKFEEEDEEEKGYYEDKEEDEEEEEEEFEFNHDFGDIILESYQDYISSNLFWYVESSNASGVGGPVKLKTDKIRFRHLISNKYLKLMVLDEYDDDGEPVEVYVLTTTVNPHDDGTLFDVTEVNTAGKFLSNAKALQLSHQGIWVERGDVLDDGTYVIKGGLDKSTALSLLINRYMGDIRPGKSSVVDDVNAAVVEPLDCLVGLSTRNYIQKYYSMIVLPKNDTINTLWPSANRGDLEFFKGLVTKLVFFSQGFPIAAQNVQLGIDKSDPSFRQQRQKLLKEQGIVEVILKMIHKLVRITDRIDEIKNLPKKQKKHPISEAETACLSMGQLILEKCFHLLYYIILDNPDNQMFVADFMPALLAHLSSQPLAGKCVTEMLSKNMELQETKIGTREIQIFVDKLRSSKMNAMYLQLLQSCCSCEGDGVDNNQGKVAKLLFSNTNDIIINMTGDFTRCKETDWGDNSLYVDNVAGATIRGEILIQKGLPQLSLAWTTNSIDFSPLGLFGRLSVKVEDLFGNEQLLQIMDGGGGGGAEMIGKKSNKKGAQEQKLAVANYFIAEMFLGAEMCMDRNYISMHKLDELFPYETLVTVVKMDVWNSLKAAAVRLLMCLHVDRDPQASSKIPCLTRTWSDIERNDEPQLPCVELGRRYTFGLIQQLISEHVEQMANNRWDDLSKHMLKMLRTLVTFNFYGTNERLKDVIGPLIAALDRRNVGKSKLGVSTTTLLVEAVKEKGKEETVSKPVGEGGGGVGGAGDVEEGGAVTGTAGAGVTGGGGDDTNDQSMLVEKTDKKSSSSWWFGWFSSSTGGGKDSKEGSEESGSKNFVSPLEAYRVPSRYAKAPIHELTTMVEAVDILQFAQKVIEDRNISILLRYFYSWRAGKESRSPSEIFEQVCVDAKDLSLEMGEFDLIMIDNLMFEDNSLVQSALELLMAHHSMRQTLLENTRNVQLFVSAPRERQYRIVDQMLRQLEQNAETHELWGELQSDGDYAVNKQTKDILQELIDICRIKRYVLEFDEDYMADGEIQDLLRNLGCFEICMKVMGLLDSIEEEDEEEGEDGGDGGDGEDDEGAEKREKLEDEVTANTRSICLLCNTLLYWFFLGNPKNQSLGYDELEMFLDTLDDRINSHLVILAVFKNNESLMRQVPHSHLATLVDKIIKNGKSHHYLALFQSISHDGDRNIVENQFEIVKSLTSPGRLQKVSCFFVSVDHPEYELKRELMAPYLKYTKDLSLDDMPPLLAYHLMFLEVLSGCTVGRLNITTVEAKVQSVFTFVDILQSILDPGTITACKIRLSNFFYNSIIEVELKIPGLEQSPDIWKLLESYKSVLLTAKQDFEAVEKVGWGEASGVSRQKIEYILVSMMIIKGFFTHYYQSAAFSSEDQSNTKTASSAAANTVGTPGKMKFSLTHVDELILFFFTKIKEVHDLQPTRLSDEMKIMIYNTLQTLNKSITGSNLITNNLRPPGKSHLLSSPSGKAVQAVPDDEDSAMEPVEDPEKVVIDSYHQFLSEIESDTTLMYKADNENVAFISILESLPFIADPVEADVRYESLIKKLVAHIRENISIVNNQKRMDVRVTKTSTWIVRAFRTMIENRMGMSIYERDEDGGLEQDEAAAPVVNALNNCGATALCLDLIADGIDERLQLEAVKLGVALLFKEGGALEVQQIMNTHLNATASDLFFKQVRISLQKLVAWHDWQGIITLPEGEEPKLKEEILILRFLQLMSEGHFLPNQDIMREQLNNLTTFNLLEDFVGYLNCLSRIPCRTSTQAAIRLSATILEVIQGPCEGNQIFFALNTELIETLNRLNRAKGLNDCVAEEEIELKTTCLSIFQGLLEGQREKSVVYERVLSVIHLDIIQMMSKGIGILDEPPEEEGQSEEKAAAVMMMKKALKSDEQVILETECMILLQQLCNFKPSLYEELGISRNIKDIVGSGTSMIEVIWRGDIHRVFFHVPNICSYLAKSSKDSLVENIDRKNPENKLVDFLNRAHELYLEVKHQQYLTEMNLSRVFSRSNQNRCTWITFILAFLINVLLLFDYTVANDSPEISASIARVINVLNAVQAVISAFVLLLFVVVHSPVKFQYLQEQGHSYFNAVYYTATDGMILYYIWYLVFSICAQVISYNFLPFLLLDIIMKDSTTRDVLNAVIVPLNQIVMASVVTLFVVQVYTFFLFLYFRDEFQPQGFAFCDTFFNCYLVGLGYGLRSGGGVGDVFNVSIAKRWLLDISFFFVVNVGMLNLVGGVIITTFGQLRENKMRRTEDTLNVCFICSIDKQVFDRASEEPDGFQTHIKVDHNMWNYLYYIFLLWEQDRDDDDGLEQFVRRAIDANEIVWFPTNKAIRLNQAATKEESLINDIKSKVSRTQTNIAGKLDRFQTDINIILEQLNQTLKQDHTAASGGGSSTSGGGGGGGGGGSTAGHPPSFQLASAHTPLTSGGEGLVGAVSATASAKPSARSISSATGSATGSTASMKAQSRRSSSASVHSLAAVSKGLMVKVMDIHGLASLPSGVETVFCTISLDEVVHTIHTNAIDGSVITFPKENSCHLVEEIDTFDERNVKVQVLYGDPVSDDVVELIATTISIEELLLADGTRYEVLFDPWKFSDAGKIALVPMIVTKVK